MTFIKFLPPAYATIRYLTIVDVPKHTDDEVSFPVFVGLAAGLFLLFIWR